MPIPVTCQCGSRFAAPDHLAGKQVACPQCKRPLVINRAAGGPAAKAPAKPNKPAAPAGMANASNQDGFWDEAGTAANAAPGMPAAGGGHAAGGHGGGHGGDDDHTAKLLRQAANPEEFKGAKESLADYGSQNMGIGLALALISGILIYLSMTLIDSETIYWISIAMTAGSLILAFVGFVQLIVAATRGEKK